MTDQQWIALSDAALRLGMSYYRTLRLVHIRKLESRKTENGRWWVSEESLARVEQERTGVEQS